METIIIKNWELFKPILQDKKRFEVFFSEIQKYRNTIAHGRNITSSQENLINGILSDLKTLMTIYHNKNEMKNDYFIRIIKINDNLGNIWEENRRPLKNPELRVGDEYEINIEAIDPKGRKIIYNLQDSNGFKIKNSENNRINFKVDFKSIGVGNWFIITVETPDSEYKNVATNSIVLTILPE